MAKNLSIRFSASSSAASITQTTDSVPSNQPTTGEAANTSLGDESSVRLLPGDDASLDSYYEIEDELVDHSICDINRPSGDQENAISDIDSDRHKSSFNKEDLHGKNKINSITVGAKVDKFVRQLHESINSSSSACSNKQEALVTSWCKFAKSDDSLEIISSSSQAESDDLHRETVSITLTPASASPPNVAKSSTSTTTASSSSWLSEMKLYNSFRDKWRNEKKCSEDGSDCNSCDGTARKSTGSQIKSVGPVCSSPLPSPSQVTISNPYLNNNYLANNSRLHNTCGSCSSRGNQNNVQQQPLPTPHQQAPFYCSCSRDADQNKCSSPQRTPTPPQLLPSSEVVFDSNSDPYLTSENPMIFPFRSKTDGKEKKEKKEKEVKDSKKSKLFSSSHNSHSKDKDSNIRKKSKEPKEKEKDLMKIISTRSSSVSSSNSLLSPSANSNSSTSLSSFLSIISSSSTKNSSPTQSRSSSTENIDATNDNPAQSIPNGLSLKNIPKTSKLPSSKSMISFKKLKNETEEAVLDDDFSSMMMHTSNISSTQGNPTLRRKTESFRRDSPTSDLNFSNEDGLSMSSKSSASSTQLEPDQTQQNVSRVISQSKSRSVFSLHSGVFSWAMCFSYAYYIFALVVALVSLLISLISPLPAFLNGFVLGFMCTFLLVTVVIIYAFSNYVFVKSSDEEHRSVTPEPVSLKRSKSKKLSINGLLNIESGAFSGWVYEFIGEYEEREKNGFASRLVFLVLYGSKLHVLAPSQDLNEKRLKQLMSENKMPNFASQRIIDFSRQNLKRITLFLTKNVRNQRKYIWSKKYPICLEFNDDRSFNGGGYLVNGKTDCPESNSSVHERAKTPTVSPALLKLVIFSRSCREKEEWFWAIKSAIDAAIVSSKNSDLSLVDSVIGESLNCDFNSDSNCPDFTNPSQQQYLRILTRRFNYHTFMRANVLSTEGIGPNSPGMMTPLTWFNILLNRLSFDVLNKPNWSAYIAKKLQRKLRKLRLPYFMESLTITEIDIGTTLPKFNSVPSVPVVDDAGLWIDFDVSYSGGFTMTLETKLNLMKLKTRESPSAENVQMSLSNLNASESNFSTPISPIESPMPSPTSNPKQQKHWRGYRYRASVTSSVIGNGNELNEEFAVDSDSDLDSIVTSSEDEEPETAPADPDEADTDEKQKKVIRFVDKIASSQYFQKATQINFLRKAIEGFSKMSIMLTVQINSLSGILAINIPESPSDRLWYGFRNEPVIQITARPKVGDHDLNLHYVTNFIEKKLRAEFFNYFVIPHMDDLFIPALNTNIEQYINVVS